MLSEETFKTLKHGGEMVCVCVLETAQLVKNESKEERTPNDYGQADGQLVVDKSERVCSKCANDSKKRFD